MPTTEQNPFRLFDLPAELQRLVFAKMTEPERAAYTREPDGGSWPNGDTEEAIRFLSSIDARFESVADAHFDHNAHLVALKSEWVDTSLISARLVQQAVIDKEASTFAEEDFLFDHCRHLVIDAPMALVSDVPLMIAKAKEILLQCDALRSVTLLVDRIEHSVLEEAVAAMGEAVEEVTKARARSIKFYARWLRQLEASPSHVAGLLESSERDPEASSMVGPTPGCSMVD